MKRTELHNPARSAGSANDDAPRAATVEGGGGRGGGGEAGARIIFRSVRVRVCVLVIFLSCPPKKFTNGKRR